MSVERRSSRLSWRRVLSPVVILATVLISGCGGGGGGGSSLPQTITLSVVPSARSASLGWSPIPATPTTYNIYVDGERVGSLFDVTVFSPSFTVSPLAPSSSHCVEVRSQGATGQTAENARSNEICFSTLPTPVTGLELTGIGADGIALRWSVDADDPSITELRVVRGDGVAHTLEPTTRSFDDVGLVPQTEYCYEVRT